MKDAIRRFARSRGGATAIEYAIIGVLVSLAVIGGGTVIGQTVAHTFNTVTNGVTGSSS